MRISDWSSDVCSSDLLVAPVRIQVDRPGQRKLGIAGGIENAPIGADATFIGFLPRLVEGFFQKVVEVLPLRLAQDLAHTNTPVGPDRTSLLSGKRGSDR